MTALVHVDLVVRDMARSLSFYVDLLGCTVVEDAVITGPIVDFYSHGRSPSMRIVLLKVSSSLMMMGMLIELMQFEPDSAGKPLEVRYGSEDAIPSIWNLTFLVDDLASTLATLDAAGVKPISAPLAIDLPKTGGATLVFVRDPDGNLLEFVERRKPAAG